MRAALRAGGRAGHIQNHPPCPEPAHSPSCGNSGLQYLHETKKILHRDIKAPQRSAASLTHALRTRARHAPAALQAHPVCSGSSLPRVAHKPSQCPIGDTQAGNILLSTTDGGGVKLCDLGVSASVASHTKRSTVIGTPLWMSPELIESGAYGTSTDVWSLGITMLEMAEVNPPHHEACHLLPHTSPATLPCVSCLPTRQSIKSKRPPRAMIRTPCHL